ASETPAVSVSEAVPSLAPDAPLVVPLRPGLERDQVGGKAAGLSEIMDRCRVPAGFVVTTAAYRLHLAGGIEEMLRAAAAEPGAAAASRRARAAILSGAVPDEVRHAIGAFPLPGERLAVRSSATIEDGPLGSLAGLFDSSLGVRATDLVDRVRRTWA